MARVIHVTSVWRDGGGDLVTLATNDCTPASFEDGRILHRARSEAHVILTTGRNLRHEPGLRYPPGARVAVLTRGELPAHPALAVVDAFAMEGPPREVVKLLARGDGTVLIEAGPTTARLLYEDPPLVDELRLSVFEGSLNPRAAGPVFMAESELWTRCGKLPQWRRARQESGTWAFATVLLT